MFYLEELLKSASPDSITNLFFILLIFITFLGFLSYFRASKKAQSFSSYAPILLTSLGILGTFTGIVSGLLNFDVENIDNSITSLLSGMKTAFITSVVGVSLSILLKVCYTLLTPPYANKASKEELNISAIVRNFYTQTELITEQNGKFEKLITSLGNDSDGSILGQIKLLRGDLRDNKNELSQNLGVLLKDISSIASALEKNQTHFIEFENKLWIKLQDFADMMSKSATEAVIEALKKVIQDFNNNLTEQFGENFKHLNNAVLELVQWQENYTSQLEEMIKLYNIGVLTLEQTEKSIAQIEYSTQAIPVTMDNLNQVISANQQKITELGDHIESFAILRDKAVEAIPEVQKQITLMLDNTTQANTDLTKALKDNGEKLGNDIAEVAKSFAEKTLKSSELLSQSIMNSGESFTEKLLDSSTQLVGSISKNHNALIESGNHIEKTAEMIKEHQSELSTKQKLVTDQIISFVERWQIDFSQSIEAITKAHLEDSKRLMTRLEKESENALNRTGESINNQIKALDSALEQELSRVIGDMGKALASISNRFTSDYAELTKSMQKIVEQYGRGR